jgi:multicomponent Na+:H+ antiporter subunit D
MTVPVVALATLTILIGVLAEPMSQLAIAAAEQLLNPANYVQVVLGNTQ